MMTGRSEGECWNCGLEQTKIYGGGEELIRCELCGVVIAESGKSIITWADSREDAKMFHKRSEERYTIPDVLAFTNRRTIVLAGLATVAAMILIVGIGVMVV